MFWNTDTVLPSRDGGSLQAHAFQVWVISGVWCMFLCFVIFVSEIGEKYITQFVWVSAVSSRLTRTFPEGEKHIFFIFSFIQLPLFLISFSVYFLHVAIMLHFWISPAVVTLDSNAKDCYTSGLKLSELWCGCECDVISLAFLDIFVEVGHTLKITF